MEPSSAGLLAVAVALVLAVGSSGFSGRRAAVGTELDAGVMSYLEDLQAYP